MNILTLPGLIDPHVHLRDPGQTEKEDFYTGTLAALAGGYTTVLDMPNNIAPIFSAKELRKKKRIAAEKIVCDVGFYLGTMGDNLDELQKARALGVYGLKVYLNQTTGGFILDSKRLEQIYTSWPTELPILLHAEEETFETALAVVKKLRRKTHLCHLSTKYELEKVIEAKQSGLPVTCGVTPHHLFLNESDEKYLGPYGKMRPPLRSKKDVAFLWKHLAAIDCIESDHAPHTAAEKESDTPPNGIPGLETTVPLLLTAVAEGRLEMHDVIRLCHDEPAKIFNVRQGKGTYIEIDLAATGTIMNKSQHSKAGRTPFHGWKTQGNVRSVFIRGRQVYKNGKLLVLPGFGSVIEN
jgi:dihydroorotase-like cyclic amidohydrolase